MAVRNRAVKFELAHPNAAGIDLGSASPFVAVPPDRDDPPVREFKSVTEDRERLADWLEAGGVDTVAMESTGGYWLPRFEWLEARGFKVYWVNARHVKNVCGRNSDVLDCPWWQQLMSFGLLAGAFRPSAEARMKNRRLRASEQELAKSLRGHWRVAQLLALQQAMTLYDVYGEHWVQCHQPLESRLTALQRHPADPDPARRRSRAKKAPRFDVRTHLFRGCGVDLTRSDGIDLTTALKVIAEVGPDLSRCKRAKPFASWLRLGPGTKSSGGKLLSGALQAHHPAGRSSTTLRRRGPAHEPVRARRLPSALVRPTRSPQGHHRHRPQAGPPDLYDADQRPRIRRSRPGLLPGALAPTRLPSPRSTRRQARLSTGTRRTTDRLKTAPSINYLECVS